MVAPKTCAHDSQSDSEGKTKMSALLILPGIRRFLLAIVSLSFPAGMAQEQDTLVRVHVTANDAAEDPEGRIITPVQGGGILLEERSGRLRTLSGSVIDSVTDLKKPFVYLTPEELSEQLLHDLGAGFAIHQTQHFVICSDASGRYTEYCGRLLERVYSEFLEFMNSSEVPLSALTSKLPVIIFGRSDAFQEFAAKQHPDTDFSDVPGYYSVRDNQMLIAALSGDRAFRTNSDVLRELRKKTRQVETIVHEAVHQLAFNTGLQVRFADNPMWLSEGLAVYFEQVSGRGSLIWSRPGNPSAIHLPGFKNAVAGERLRLPLSQLLASDEPFESQENLAAAYAESWALTYFLIRTRRKAFDRLMNQISSNKPLRPVGAEGRLKQVTDATGMTATELETAVIRYVSRLRTR